MYCVFNQLYFVLLSKTMVVARDTSELHCIVLFVSRDAKLNMNSCGKGVSSLIEAECFLNVFVWCLVYPATQFGQIK